MMKIIRDNEKRDQGNIRKKTNGTSINKNIGTKIKRKIPMDGVENKPDTNGRPYGLSHRSKEITKEIFFSQKY